MLLHYTEVREEIIGLSNMKRSVTSIVFNVDIHAALDQLLHLFDIATYCSDMQRRLSAFISLVQLLVGGCLSYHGLR